MDSEKLTTPAPATRRVRQGSASPPPPNDPTGRRPLLADLGAGPSPNSRSAPLMRIGSRTPAVRLGRGRPPPRFCAKLRDHARSHREVDRPRTIHPPTRQPAGTDVAAREHREAREENLRVASAMTNSVRVEGTCR